VVTADTEVADRSTAISVHIVTVLVVQMTVVSGFVYRVVYLFFYEVSVKLLSIFTVTEISSTWMLFWFLNPFVNQMFKHPPIIVAKSSIRV
jgi:hypothetical protein